MHLSSSKHCSPLVEFMFVKCRPFYLPREFTAIVIVAVYIPPCANAKDALCELYSAISEQQTNNPDGFFIIAGDFNHANLKTVLPKFYQHVNFATRGNNTLDFVYTTEKNAYKAVPHPHFGYSDHISVMLIPAYRPLLKLAKPVQKHITIWPENATSTLQDCFQCTDWNMFKEAATYNNHTDLQEYTETVTAYIKKCIDDVTVTKTITTRANQKLWMTAEVRVWFESYLSDRSFKVSWRGEVSKSQHLAIGVPQGSVLGPLLFSVYMASLGSVIQKHGFLYHCYADDTQLYLSFHPDDPTIASRISACLTDISCWMKDHHLQLNLAETELLVVSANPSLHHNFTLPVRLINHNFFKNSQKPWNCD